MSETKPFDPREASGESAMSGSRPLQLNEVSLNGDGSAKQVSPGKWEQKGGYFRKRILINKPKDAKPEEVNLGETVSVVFLKIRRRLVERGKDGEIVRSTNEHNSPNESVTLYEGASNSKKTGVAADLRKEFPNLRTIQIVYALLVDGTAEPELVRVIVKGASLGSDVKAKDVPSFYDYISSFKGDEHFYQFKTVLTPVQEEGAQTYFAINFQRGDKLTEKSYELALGRMCEVHENCTEVDTQRAMRIVKETTGDPGIVPGGTELDKALSQHEEEEHTYPKDEIDPADIPF